MRDSGLPDDREIYGRNWVAGLAMEALGHLVSVRDQECADVKQENLDAFMDVLCGDAPVGPTALLEAMMVRQANPVTAASLYIPEAARCLGERWEADQASFVEVTICTERLHSVVRHVDDLLAQNDSGDGPSVLVVVAEAEQHTLGACVLALQLRQAGLATTVRIAPLAAELKQLLSATKYDVALVSVGCTTGMIAGAGLVKTLRLLSRGELRIVAGGSIPVADEVLRDQTGADVVIRDVSALIDGIVSGATTGGVDRPAKRSEMIGRTSQSERGRS